MLKLAALCLLFSVLADAAVYQNSISYRAPKKLQAAAEGRLEEYVANRNARVAKFSTGTNQIIDYEDMAYMTTITLGTPAQMFVVFLDSGSGNLWVPDESCTGGNSNTCGTYCKSTPYETCLTFCQPSCCTQSAHEIILADDACTAKHRFNQSASSTYVVNNGKFDITYSTGEVKGFFGQDVFCLGNACTSTQVFGQAQSIGGGFGNQPEDGIIGLGWPALASGGVTPPMFNLMNAGVLDQPYFVVYLAQLGPTTSSNGGAFTVGGLDTVNCDSTIDWIPLTSQTFWQFKMSSVAAGTYSNSGSGGWQAVSDTASSFIGGPKAVIDSLATAVGAKYSTLLGSYFIDCEANGPDVIFSINGFDFHVQAKDYVLSMGAGPCMFSFFALESSGFYPAWMLGPPLIREYCQIHDMQNARIGMAKSIQKS